ncbi:MAG: DUF4339 domain-containing protein [Planctomycetes bacterium]|nr:DUF4339 domain-containing protein [Planctomycetota bacterium]
MAEMWYYTNEGKQMDPVTLKELKRMAGDGSLKPTDMVWKDGMPRWIRANSVTELFPDPSSALDQYFTQTRQEKQDPSKTGVVPAGGSTASASTGTTSTKRKTSADDEDDAGPPRRRAESAAGGGSGIGIFLAMGCAVIILMGGLLAGVVLLVLALRPSPDDAKKDAEKDRKDGEVGAPLDGPVTYEALLKAREAHTSKPYNLKAGVFYQAVISRAEPNNLKAPMKFFVRGPDGNDFKFKNNMVGTTWEWKAKQDGDHRLYFELQDGDPINATITLREKGDAPQKPPLPADTKEGKSQFQTPAALKPKDVYEQKLRVQADYAATISFTAIDKLKGTKIDLVVVKDSDRNAVIAKSGPKASVAFRVNATEIVVVRVINSGPTTVRVNVIYNVSKD